MRSTRYLRYRVREFLESILACLSLNTINAKHPMGRQTLLYGGTLDFAPQDKKSTDQWDDSGQIRFANTMRFRRTGGIRVRAFQPGESGNIDVCHACRQCIPVVFIENPRVILKHDAPLWARVWFRWWRWSGRVTA